MRKLRLILLIHYLHFCAINRTKEEAAAKGGE